MQDKGRTEVFFSLRCAAQADPEPATEAPQGGTNNGKKGKKGKKGKRGGDDDDMYDLPAPAVEEEGNGGGGGPSPSHSAHDIAVLLTRPLPPHPCSTAESEGVLGESPPRELISWSGAELEGVPGESPPHVS